MGKKPDEIQREIEKKRADIGQRIEGLQHRAQEDVQAVRAEAKDRSSHALEDAKGQISMDTVKQLVDEHTLSTMAGAVGVGVLLGVASEGFKSSGGGGGRNGHSNGRSNGASNGGGGGIAGIMASFMGPAASTAQNELEDLVREGFASLKGQVRQGGQEDKRVENRDLGVE